MDEPQRIEDFRSDVPATGVSAAEAAYARSIASLAYLEAFPAFLHLRQLTEFIAGRRHMAPGECPLGGWFLMRELATPATTTVSPNVDTLYGATYVLLDVQGPVVLGVPPIPDRYWSVAFCDARFDVFAILGPRTAGNEGADVLLVPPGWQGTAPAGITRVIEATTPSVCLLQRVFVRDASECASLHAVQDAIRLVPLDRWGTGDERFPDVDLAAYALTGVRETRDPLRFFELTNAYLGVNPPPARDEGLAALGGPLGLGPGATLPDDPATREAIALGARDAQALVNARISSGTVRDGWRVPDPSAGRADALPLDRAVTQATQMGLFPADEAVYWFAYADADGSPLDGTRGATLRLPVDRLPPIDPLGFWSLTMYGEDSLLVANEIDRYAVRPDMPRLVRDPDGGITIHLAAARPEPALGGNWLPAPAGRFNVALRVYQPGAAIASGAWFPPGIARLM